MSVCCRHCSYSLYLSFFPRLPPPSHAGHLRQRKFIASVYRLHACLCVCTVRTYTQCTHTLAVCVDAANRAKPKWKARDQGKWNYGLLLGDEKKMRKRIFRLLFGDALCSMFQLPYIHNTETLYITYHVPYIFNGRRRWVCELCEGQAEIGAKWKGTSCLLINTSIYKYVYKVSSIPSKI